MQNKKQAGQKRPRTAVLTDDTGDDAPDTEAPIKPETKLRRWCFTSFDGGVKEEPPVRPNFTHPRVKYGVAQREITKEGRIHWQGYVEVKDASGVTLSTIKKILGIECHLIMAKGNSQQNTRYCTKIYNRNKDTGQYNGTQARYKRDEEPYVVGEPTVKAAFVSSDRGKRVTDVTLMDEVMEMINNGATLEEISTKYPGFFALKFDKITIAKGLYDNRNLTKHKPNYFEVRVGPPGAGKTASVFDNEKGRMNCAYFNPPLCCWHEKYIYLKRAGLGEIAQWFQGYNPSVHKVLVLDDMKIKSLSDLQWLMSVTDCYRSEFNVKHSSVYGNWETVIFCTNIHPDDWWDNLHPGERNSADARSAYDALRDRLGDNIHVFPNNNYRARYKGKPWVAPKEPSPEPQPAQEDIVVLDDDDAAPASQVLADAALPQVPRSPSPEYVFNDFIRPRRSPDPPELLAYLLPEDDDERLYHEDEIAFDI
jgi:hypothetical protein